VPYLCHVCTGLGTEGHQHGSEAGSRQPCLQVTLYIYLHSSSKPVVTMSLADVQQKMDTHAAKHQRLHK
jgi:hypothetical protein